MKCSFVLKMIKNFGLKIEKKNNGKDVFFKKMMRFFRVYYRIALKSLMENQ